MIKKDITDLLFKYATYVDSRTGNVVDEKNWSKLADEILSKLNQPTVNREQVLDTYEISKHLKIIEELGFKFEETQEVEETDEKVDFYVNETHRIAYWKERGLWSLKHIETTRTTMIIPFENIMSFYFDNITS